jgi:hypothetical protein
MFFYSWFGKKIDARPAAGNKQPAADATAAAGRHLLAVVEQFPRSNIAAMPVSWSIPFFFDNVNKACFATQSSLAGTTLIEAPTQKKDGMLTPMPLQAPFGPNSLLFA